MGNAATGAGGRRGSSSADPSVPVPYSAVKHASSIEYFVQPYRAAPGIPENLIFRLDPEAAVVLDATNGAVLKIWPYHLVLCWGYTETTFQLKAFLPGEKHAEESEGPRVLIPTPSLRNIKVPEGSAEIEAVVMTTTQGPEMEKAMMAAVTALLSEIEKRGLPEARFSALLASLDELEVRASARVGALCRAESRGGVGGGSNAGAVGDGMICAPLLLLLLLPLQGADNASEQIIASVRQVSSTFRLDVRQAIDLVRAVARLSPFDKVRSSTAPRSAPLAALPPPSSSSVCVTPSPAPLCRAAPEQVDAMVAVYSSLLARPSFTVLLDACCA
jgi:hypothetical protein